MLHRNGLVGEKDLSAAIAETVGLRFVDFTEYPIHPDAATTIPEAESPVSASRSASASRTTKLVVAFADPGDDDAVQAIGTATGYEIIPAAAGRYEILHAIDSVFGPDRSSAPSLDEPEPRHRRGARRPPRQRAPARCCSSRRARTSTSPRGARR